MWCGEKILLHALRARFGVDKGLKYRQHVAAVIEHPGKNIAQRGIALGFTVPLQKHRGWNFNVPPQFFGRVSAQEQPIEESGFPLREVKIVLRFFGGIGGGKKRRVGYSLHLCSEAEREVYRNFSRRQVARAYFLG